MPWRVLLTFAVLASVIFVFATRRSPESPSNRRLFFAIRVVLLIAVLVLFYLAFFHHPAA
jgi:drug/metabolite transporter (DMT)-like permease